MFALALALTLAVVLGLSLQVLALPAVGSAIATGPAIQPAHDPACIMTPTVIMNKYRVRMLGWGHHGPDGCGRGLLDNLNGQAAASTGWTCQWDAGAEGVNGTAWFNMPLLRDNDLMTGSTTKVNYAMRLAGAEVLKAEPCPR
ncbi:MAG: hypothetical protein M1832_003097 [Thelocarpon impressellum]|nr:MAG: hypothetical protein M1832_003097 [Thelocarpon impressellum]